MKRLFVVNGLFGFLNCMSSGGVAEHDELTVLVLFSSDPASNAVLERRMRSLAPVSKCVFLTEPGQYIGQLADPQFMSDLCRNPGEVRMFFTHNTWLHNRVFAAYPDARIVLYEEGLASYYPGLIDRYDEQSRVAGIYCHNYLDLYVSPEAAEHPEKFGLLNRDRFRTLLTQASTEPQEQVLTPETVVVVEQYLFKKGRAQSLEDAAEEYAEAVRSIVDKGYEVAYKRHPRESSRLYELVRDRLDAAHRDRVVEFPDSGGLLEEVILHQPPAAIVAISSTSLLTVPHYFNVPSFTIRSRAPYDVAKAVGVERRGLTSNQVALAARVPSIDDLPNVLHLSTAMDIFRARFTRAPRLCDDGALRALGEVDFGPEYVELVRRIADPAVRAVSFDLFDTLVKRPAVNASDVFALLDRRLRDQMPKFVRFSDVRSTAFRRLDAHMKQHGGRPAEYALSQVYDYIGTVLGIDAEVQASLMAEEVELEAELVQLRRAGFALTQVAEAYDKPWAVTTDTYFDEDQLNAVALAKLSASAHHVTTSLQEQKTKAAGDLFAVTAAAFDLPKKAILHIGDRKDHDVDNAERAGLEGAWLPSATHAAQSHPRLAAIWKDVREERASALLRGMVHSEVFDNPYRDFADDSTCGGSPELLGYLAVAPALIGWSSWILQTAAEHGNDALLFLSRDGYLPLEICQRLAEDSQAGVDHAEDTSARDSQAGEARNSRACAVPDMSYVMSSRRAMFDLFNQARGHVGYTEFVHGLSPRSNVRTMLTTRFGASAAEEFGPPIAAAGPGSADAKIGKTADSVKNALSQFSESIVEQCAGNDRAARDYFRHAVGEATHPAIVDVGYSGSAQRGITLALGRNVAGLYFTTMEHNTEHAAINDLEVAEFTTDPVFFRSGGMLEYLITPPGLESCTGFDPVTGNPVFEDSDTPDPIRNAVHAGVRQCIDDFFRIFSGHTGQFVMRPRLASHMLASFMSDPSRTDALSLEGGRHEDTVGSDADDVFDYWKEGRSACEAKAPARSADDREHTQEAEGLAKCEAEKRRSLEQELEDARAEIAELRSQTAATSQTVTTTSQTVTTEAKALASRVGHGLEWRARRVRKNLISRR
ncbi:HAD family hydrolase [Brevibacterium marinum]|uniref:FMN phosphatase YigB (HAD superfamily) n=1 Tax=Brevibacterium marinum TaxID=418643 RepID=A0A846RX44_9MICO|nr:HAD family hydrolase [Brevibacterium marinum]NJC56536.1 FMN phosphatase YigB (HAD superfamily) [Brevibacterium marinum]